MTAAEIIVSVVSICTPIVSVVVAIIVARRSKDKDTKNDGQEKGVLLSDIGYIKSSTDRIEKRLDSLEKQQSNMAERLVALETKLDAHLKDRNAHNYKGGI